MTSRAQFSSAMNTSKSGRRTPTFEQLSAAAGYAALVCGAGAVALELQWPSTSDPAALPEFIADNRAAILGQSVLFLISAGLMMWFLGTLRTFLGRAGAAFGSLTTVGFAAGMVAYGVNVVGQAPQLTLTLRSAAGLDPTAAATLTDLGYVILVVANVPLAVMFAAIAVVSLLTRVFPPWLGWIAAAAAISAVLLTMSIIDPTGPLAPQGWLSYVLYLAPVVWLIPATTVMIRRIGRRRSIETS